MVLKRSFSIQGRDKYLQVKAEALERSEVRRVKRRWLPVYHHNIPGSAAYYMRYETVNF